jgi:drug/metabolite transporter (DMT)-like permease
MKLTRTQGIALVLLTLLWGVNWPVMKSAVSVYPPMSFRALSMLFGVPCLALGLVCFKVPFTIPRQHWRELAVLALTNMVVWHVCVMIALPGLTSGRAAILGYTMPVFSALWGLSLYGQRLQARQAIGIFGAGAGVVLLLWHEVARLSGTPVSAAVLLFGTSIWALGTQQLRRTKIEVPTLAIAFWMTVIATIVVCAWSVATESARWALPSTGVVGAIAFNAVLVFGFCHAAWFSLARSLPPVASSVSVCMIPVVGLLSGAWFLGEALHWQDFVAIVMIALAIATVLWPARAVVGASPLREA